MSLQSIVAPMQLQAMARLLEGLPAGDVAEVGVFNGGSAEVLYAVCQRQGRGLHLFDTFRGTPIADAVLDKHKVGEFMPEPNIEAKIRASLPRATLYPGTYPTTHPGDLPPLAFIHCDCDQYESYRAVIRCMWPHVVRGGAMLFDDYPYLEGAKRAVNEVWDHSELKLCYNRNYVIKV